MFKRFKRFFEQNDWSALHRQLESEGDESEHLVAREPGRGPPPFFRPAQPLLGFKVSFLDATELHILERDGHYAVHLHIEPGVCKETGR